MNGKQQLDATKIAANPLGCIELWAGNDLVHRHIELAGLEADVLSLPYRAREGGDLYALFSCGGQQEARIVLADCVGHGLTASLIAANIHALIHRHRDIPDNSRFLASLNDEFALWGQTPGAPLRLSTIVAASFNRRTGEFNFAYAAHPHMLFWRARHRHWVTLEGLNGLPLGAFAGSVYTQQSIRLEHADIVLMFSDGATEVFSPDHEMLTAEGLLELASETLEKFPAKFPLPFFVEALVKRIRDFHGGDDLEDDLMLLTLRCSPFTSSPLQ